MCSKWIRGLVLAAAVIGVVSAHTPVEQGRRVIRIRAERFSFTPSEIQLKSGEEVELRIKSDDTNHGFRITGTDVDIVIPKRGAGESSVIFSGAKPGRYEFECTRLCGAGHSYMRGVIVVKENTEAESGGRR